MRNLAFAQDNLFPRVVHQGDYPGPSIRRDGEDYGLTHWEPVCRAMTKVVGSACGEAGSFAGRNWQAFAYEAPAYSFTVIRLKAR